MNAEGVEMLSSLKIGQQEDWEPAHLRTENQSIKRLESLSVYSGRSRLVSEEEFKSPTFGVGLEVSVREIGGKTLVPLLNELLSMASESSSATDLKSASAFETASKLTANGIATLGTLDLNKFSGGLKNVSKSTVEGTGLIFQDLVKVVSSPISDPSLEMLILPDADGKPSSVEVKNFSSNGHTNSMAAVCEEAPRPLELGKTFPRRADIFAEQNSKDSYTAFVNPVSRQCLPWRGPTKEIFWQGSASKGRAKCPSQERTNLG
ncbi:unnamed protein product [Sphagnum jensenii]